MRHALKLGPVQLDAASTNVYLLINDAGDVAPPAFASTDEDGLRELMAASEPEGVVCAPELREAAAALGLGVAAPGARAMEVRAAIAVFMAWGQRGLAPLGSDTALLLLPAMTEFWRARPWVHWREHQAIEVQVTGALKRTYEAAVFGREPHGYGIALYEQKGSLEKIRALEAAGEGLAARQFPGVGVLLDGQPDYAIHALGTAGLAPRLPVLGKSGPQGSGLPRPEETLVLATSLRALAAINPASRLSTRALSWRGMEVTVNVTAPGVMVWN